MKKWKLILAEGWVEYWTDGMKTSTSEKIMSMRSQATGGEVNPHSVEPVFVTKGLPNIQGTIVNEVYLKSLASVVNAKLEMTYEQEATVIIQDAIPPAPAPAPTAVVLAVGATNPVGGVVNVAIPADGATDSTGQVTGWAANETVKFTVTDAPSTSSVITMNDAAYTSGADYALATSGPLVIKVVTSGAGYADSVRTFNVLVSV